MILNIGLLLFNIFFKSVSSTCCLLILFSLIFNLRIVDFHTGSHVFIKSPLIITHNSEFNFYTDLKMWCHLSVPKVLMIIGGTVTIIVLFFPFRLVPLLPQWPERGLEPLTQCLRASTDKTRTHGFFVALLEKHTDAGKLKQEPGVQIR